MGKNDFSSCVIQKYPSEIEESVCFRLPRRACFGFAHLRTSLPIMTALWSESSYVFAKMKTFRMKIHCVFQVSVVIIPSTNSLAKKFDLQCCCLCSLQPRLQCGILQEFPACHERFGQQRYGLFWSWEKWMNTTLIPSKMCLFCCPCSGQESRQQNVFGCRHSPHWERHGWLSGTSHCYQEGKDLLLNQLFFDTF